MTTHELKKSKRKKVYLFLFLFWIIGIVSLLSWKYIQTYYKTTPFSQNSPNVYPEVKALTGNAYDFTQLKRYYTKLAQKKGGVYAYEVLKRADIPPNTDVHLLGHVVGEQLYKQQGIEGMKYCTQDFRNACSHTIVVGMLLQYGENIFNQIDAACKKAPGGYGAYTMCYHGIGHGVLAYEGFDFQKAVKLCRKTQQYGSTGTYGECIGGTVMEIIGGGDHDKETWKKESQKYLSRDDPLSLCKDNGIQKSGNFFCYTYLTPHLFTRAGFNPHGTYDEKSFAKAFTYCDAIPKQDVSDRNACFGGFGKEFVVLAKDRDIRNVSTMTPRQLEIVSTWCHLASHEEGTMACIYSAVLSLLWGGENPPDAAVKFCSLIPDQKEQQRCFTHLFSVVNGFIKNKAYQENVCNLVPKHYITHCKNE